jgi:hypothetical protein
MMNFSPVSNPNSLLYFSMRPARVSVTALVAFDFFYPPT